MTVDDLLIESVVNSIPQWYFAECGPYEYKLKCGATTKKFYSVTPPSERLLEYLKYANLMLSKWKEILNTSALPVHYEFVQGVLALKWLSTFNKRIHWSKLLMFLREAGNRSFENRPININLIVSQGIGKETLINPLFRKYLDALSRSNHIFFRVDKRINFISYEEIAWSAVKETATFKFSPEFLQPIASILKDDEISVHLINGGDVIFMNKDGIIASLRKNYWHFYDVHNFNETAKKLLNIERASLLLEIALDLSYNRSGALVIYDSDEKAIKHIVNKNSVIDERFGQPDTFRGMISESLRFDSEYKRKTNAIRVKRLFTELANIDGAIICTNDKILAVGAMIKPHPKVAVHAGTRATAAESAYRWGGVSLSVSADGEMRIYFNTGNEKNRHCGVMKFM